jgi:monoamine oxidase
MVALLDVFRAECALIDLDNPTKTAQAREIDQLTFREFCVQKAQSEDAIEIANLLSTCLVGVESDEVSALCMLLYFKSGAGIDNIISDQKDGGQYLRNRQGKSYLLLIMDI